MQEFTAILKRFGPLAALQVAVFVLPAVIFRENTMAVVILQMTGIQVVTWLACGAAYQKGASAAKDESSEAGSSS